MISNPVFHMIKGYIINRDNEEQYIEMDNKEDKSTAVNSEKSKEKKIMI